MAVSNKPGTRIRTVLRSFGIHPHFGCGCTALANKMDKAGSKKVLEELDSYANEMYNSIKKWRKENDTVIVIQPPLFVVRSFISWACSA